MRIQNSEFRIQNAAGWGRCAVLAALIGTIGGCQGLEKKPAGGAATQAVAGGVTAGGMSATELRDVLADLGRAHGQKVQLAWWVSTPLRPVSPQFVKFYENMGVQQKELLAELKGWAKTHQVDLTFHYTSDVYSEGQRIMEKRQEAMVREDDQVNFERDNLMQMHQDYEWQVSLLKALLPSVKEAGLKAYLEKSLAVHEAGSKEIVGLLRGYKFQK